jgi:hypothetical protein
MAMGGMGSATAAAAGEANKGQGGVPKVQPTSVRYIKLGASGEWLHECLESGYIKFTDPVPHEIAAAGDWEGVRRIFAQAGRGSPSRDVAELQDFYQQDEHCLWVTFGRGSLLWAFAEPEVTPTGGGDRIRRTIGPWRSTDIYGCELRVSDLSSRLTKVGGYRRAICTIAAEDYLVGRINADTNPLALETDRLRDQLVASIERLIADLHWRDFEVLVDLIFTTSGWRRLSSVGGAHQADTDLILEQRATGERALVQVKSQATAAQLREVVERFRGHPDADRVFIVCHSPKGALAVPDEAGVHLWTAPALAEQVLAAGLADWVVAKTR